MMNQFVELIPYGGAGVALFAAGGYYVVKIVKEFRNGKNGSEASDARMAAPPGRIPECPSKTYFEDRRVEDMRRLEAFKAMVVSWDRVVGALEMQSAAISKSGEKHAEAIVKMAELVTRRRHTDV